jgi:hypothetical protein
MELNHLIIVKETNETSFEEALLDKAWDLTHYFCWATYLQLGHWAPPQ